MAHSGRFLIGSKASKSLEGLGKVGIKTQVVLVACPPFPLPTPGKHCLKATDRIELSVMD